MQADRTFLTVSPKKIVLEYNGKVVSDTDRCSSDAQCANRFGSFVCTCVTGYLGNGINCTSMAANCMLSCAHLCVWGGGALCCSSICLYFRLTHQECDWLVGSIWEQAKVAAFVYYHPMEIGQVMPGFFECPHFAETRQSHVLRNVHLTRILNERAWKLRALRYAFFAKLAHHACY